MMIRIDVDMMIRMEVDKFQNDKLFRGGKISNVQIVSTPHHLKRQTADQHNPASPTHSSTAIGSK